MQKGEITQGHRCSGMIQKMQDLPSNKPWLHINPNYPEINVEKALEEKRFPFYTYKKLIQLRHEHPIVVWGTYNLVDTEDENIFAYCRVLDEQKWLIITNFQEKTTTF